MLKGIVKQVSKSIRDDNGFIELESEETISIRPSLLELDVHLFIGKEIQYSIGQDGFVEDLLVNAYDSKP